MSHTRPNPQHNESDQQRAARKKQPSAAGVSPEFAGGLNTRQRSVLHLQRTIGNAAVQRLLVAPQSRHIQRQDLSEFGLGPANASTSDPSPTPTAAPTTQADGGEERLTSQEWLGRVQDSTVILSNPMIGFTVGDTFAGFPAKVESFDFSIGGEAQ